MGFAGRHDGREKTIAEKVAAMSGLDTTRLASKEMTFSHDQ